jgi:Tol biopolymer transport system component
MTAEGRDRRQVSDGSGDDRSASWSDGQTLIYQYDWHEPHAAVRARTRAPDGSWSEPRTLLQRSTYTPTVSPDGRMLAFGAPDGLWTAQVTGDSVRRLAESVAAAQPLFAAWSRDGRTVYYLAVDSTDRAGIWSVPRTGGRPRLEVEFDEPARQWHRYGFAVQGDRFYLTLGDRESDVWAAQVQGPAGAAASAGP